MHHKRSWAICVVTRSRGGVPLRKTTGGTTTEQGVAPTGEVFRPVVLRLDWDRRPLKIERALHQGCGGESMLAES